MKFIVEKRPKLSKQNKGVMYRIPDTETQQALCKALEDSGLSAQQLVDQMVKHCLKESGYLK